MSNGDDAAEETRNKLSQRFKGEDRDKKDKKSKKDNGGKNDNGGQNESGERQGPWDSSGIDRVKSAWKARTYYIPDEVTERMDREHDRLQYEVRDIDIKQARHFVPVLLEHGLQSIEDMSGDEFKTALNELDILEEN